MAKPVQMWQAEDGSVHHDKVEAEMVDHRLAVRQRLEALFKSDAGMADTVACIRGFDEILDFMVRKRAQFGAALGAVHVEMGPRGVDETGVCP